MRMRTRSMARGAARWDARWLAVVADSGPGPGEYTCNYTLLLRRHGRFHRWVINRILHSADSVSSVSTVFPASVWIRTEIIYLKTRRRLCRSLIVVDPVVLYTISSIASIITQRYRNNYVRARGTQTRLPRMNNEGRAIVGNIVYLFERYAWVFPREKPSFTYG